MQVKFLVLPIVIMLTDFGVMAQSTDSLKLATMAAPQNMRDSATVLVYDQSGNLDTLREGTNQLICIGDDPTADGFSVACYHRELEPFMARGRELRKEGKGFREIRKIRGKEIKSGKLPMPDKSTLYVFTGEYDPATGEVSDGYLRYVIYIPFATSETTGLPDGPVSEGGPWIMDAGTHRAHIMVNPKK